jgi:transcriptional regulator of acetoin/glycerol metabolism
MVIQSARDIENAYFMHNTQDCWRLRAHPMQGYVDSQPELLFAWNNDGVLTAINPAGRRYLIKRLGHIPQHFREAFNADSLRTNTDYSHHFLPDHQLYVRLDSPLKRAYVQAARPVAEVDAQLGNALQKAVLVKNRDLPVLIHGETGSGKEHFAQTLHRASARSEQPFIAVNCAAIPDSLIESELFGYAPGAFTGASSKGKQGLIKQANGGTLFLDEIGDMPLSLQTRLLRVLSEGEVAPLGATRAEKIDVQVICASHKDIETLVKEGLFREDLYFRLSGARFDLPPLRDRSDKLNLINGFLENESQRVQVSLQVSEDALERLLTYSWPGNIRQLHHTLRYASAVSHDGILRIEDLPNALQNAEASKLFELPSGPPERQVLIDALVRNRWKPVLAAREMGISRATLYRKVKQHCINMPGKGSYDHLS